MGSHWKWKELWSCKALWTNISAVTGHVAWLCVHNSSWFSITFCSTVGADDAESKRMWQSFYMSSFKIAVLSQVFSSVFMTKQQSREGMQSWLQLLEDKVRHSRGWDVNLRFFCCCSDSFWQAGKCSINLKAGVCLWSVCMCWWKRLTKLWYECASELLNAMALIVGMLDSD